MTEITILDESINTLFRKVKEFNERIDAMASDVEILKSKVKALENENENLRTRTRYIIGIDPCEPRDSLRDQGKMREQVNIDKRPGFEPYYENDLKGIDKP